MKKISIKYKENFRDILLDDEDFEKFKNCKLRLNKSRSKLFVQYHKYSTTANVKFLHKIILNLENDDYRVKFIDGNTLNLQKDNMLILSEITQLERKKSYYPDNKEEYLKKAKEKYKKLKLSPEKYKEKRAYLDSKQKEYRKIKAKEKEENSFVYLMTKKYEGILSREEIKIIIDKLSKVKARSREREMECDLDFDTYTEFLLQGCYYTGANLLKQDFGGVSLDRIDNKKGYTRDNVVPCIGWVNKMRMDHMTVEETKYVIEKLIEFRNTKEKK